MYRRVYGKRVTHCDNYQLIRWVFVTYGVRIGWTELRLESERIRRKLILGHALVSLAPNLRTVDLLLA
jgi:hypothetical protein